MRANPERTGAQFQTTEWTILDELKCSDDARRRKAAEYLAKQYWPPAYTWFRQRGLSTDMASDCTQGFFHEVVLGRQLFERADFNRGRLRDWMKAALKNYLTDYHRHEKQRRDRFQFHSEVVELEESLQKQLLGSPADDAFDRCWALAILEEAIQLCQQHFSGKRYKGYWGAFELWVLQPALYGNQPTPRAEIAKLFGFTDEGYVSVAVYAVKQRFKIMLEQVVARTVCDPADSGAEYEIIQSILCR